MARVLIAGCGFLGAALAGRLVASGHAVWGLRRRPAPLPQGVSFLAADLARREGLESTLLEGTRASSPAEAREEATPGDFDIVVYAAAADRPEPPAYRSAYVDGLRNLLDTLQNTAPRVRRFFFTSSTAVYAQRDGQWVDEESPCEPTHFTGRLLLEGERLLSEGPFPASIVRLGGLYGPGRTRLIEQVRSGRLSAPSLAPRYTNRIHRDDAAGALHHLIELELGNQPVRDLYLGVDHEPADRRTVEEWLAEQLGVVVASAAGAQASRANALPGPRGEGRGNKRCRNDRLLKSDYRFVYPTFREGYGALLRDL
jgi:nucleoside-diphosphate-sugar epimerase